MKKHIVGKFTANIFLIFILLTYNNCGRPGFLLKTNSIGITALDTAADVLDGQNLYKKNCADCHGPLESSAKLGKTEVEIKQAISIQKPMKFLSFLTSEEIAKIAKALNPEVVPPTPTPVIDEKSLYQALTANRHMLASNLKELFVVDINPDSTDTSIITTIDTLVTGHPEAFGGNCSRYDNGCTNSCMAHGDGNCVGKLETSMNASAAPVPNTITQGYLIRVCEEVLKVDKSVQTALSKTGRNILASPTVEDVAILMDVFYRGKPADLTAANTLMDLVNEARSKGFTILDQWRFLLLPLCTSSGTELL